MISLSCSGEKYLRPASIETIFFFASFSFTWVARSVVGASTAGVAGSFFFSVLALSALFSTWVALSASIVGAGLACSVTIGATAFSVFGRTVLTASFSVLTSSFTVLSACSASFSFLSWIGASDVCGLSGTACKVSGAFGAGVSPSADTAWALKVKPISTEAAPTAYLRIEKRCFLFSFMIKPPWYNYFDNVYIKPI